MGFKPNQKLQDFLSEDLGKGDITSNLLEKKEISAKIITRQEAIVSGTNFAKQLFSLKSYIFLWKNQLFHQKAAFS